MEVAMKTLASAKAENKMADSRFVLSDQNDVEQLKATQL